MSLDALQVKNNAYLLFGLRWSVLDSLESTALQLNAEYEQGSRWKAELKNDLDTNIGVTAVLPAKIERLQKGKAKLYAGAAHVAAHPRVRGKTAVLVTIEEPGIAPDPSVVAVVGIINGNIVLDEALTPEQVAAQRDWFFQECHRRNLYEIEVGGHVHTIEHPEFALTWEDLAGVKSPGWFGQPYRVQPLSAHLDPRIVQALLWTSVFAVLALVAWTAFNWWKEEEAKKRALQAQQQVDIPREYAQSLAAALKKPVWNIAQLGELQSKVSRAVPQPLRGGWVLDKVSCSAISNGCNFAWKRQPGVGTLATFRDTRPQGTIQYVDTDNITVSMNIEVPPQAMAPDSDWLSPVHFLVDERSRWTRWQDRGVHFTYDNEPKLFGVPANLNPQQLAGNPDVVKSISWSLEGAPWEKDALHGLPKSATLDTVTWTFSSNGNDAAGGRVSMKFKAEGRILMRRENHVQAAKVE